MAGGNPLPLLNPEAPGPGLSLAPGVLLAVGHAELGPGRQRDSGHRSVDSSLPGAVVERLAVLVRDRVLAEVPDIALRVLGIPVLGHLGRLSMVADDVAHDASLDAVGD